MIRSLLKLALTLVLLVGIHSVASSQNIQFHFDTGRYLYPEAQAGRPYVTTTIEQQSIDKWGDTFYFVDMAWLGQGSVQANWKFMRNLRFWQGPLSWHVRYDGGLRFINANAPMPLGGQAISIKDAFFTGITYTYRSADRKLMLSLSPLYKYIKGHQQPHNYEVCAVWNYRPGNGLFTATGFLTFWQEQDSRVGWGTSHKLMTQPQFWCNLNKIKGVGEDFRLSVGTEVRISRNVDAPQWLVVPTLALKWSFGR